MSTDRSFDDVWADQVAMAKARGVEIPTELDAASAAILREIGVEVPARVYDWTGALAVLDACARSHPGSGLLTYGGRPRTDVVQGRWTEIHTIRDLIDLLFGWVP